MAILAASQSQPALTPAAPSALADQALADRVAFALFVAHPSPRMHTIDLHEAMKGWPTVWAALSLAGTQVIPADPEWDCPEERYELRNCPCGSRCAKALTDADERVCDACADETEEDRLGLRSMWSVPQ